MIQTIYDGFAKSATMAPKNAKMILRHSIRGEIPPNDTGNSILLTREGERMAEHFGRFCNFNLERIHTSVIQRCVQTATLIANGYEENTGTRLKIFPTNILTDSHITDLALADKLFTSHSPHFIMSAFLRGKQLPGIKTREETMKMLFTYIFQNRESQNMEVFVTHDTILIGIVCFCHGLQPSDFEDFWPYMLEGAFLYLQNNKIYCIFRGETKSIAFDF